MFFGKLFKTKDHRHHIAQGEKHLAAERYADARCAFQDALEKCPTDAQEERFAILAGIRESGNRLAQMNLVEGEGALNSGDTEKAADYFNLAFELADDAKLRENAEKKLKNIDRVSARQLSNNNSKHKHHAGGCSSCGGHGHHSEEIQEVAPMGLSAEDTFHLLIQPLPGDLPERYAAVGKKFAEAYLLIHDGNDGPALPILQELHRNSPSDVVMYELALIMFRAGRPGETYQLLQQALAVNPANPLVYLSLVQLATGSGQYQEAQSLLHRMLELQILPDQARVMLGEVLAAAGDTDAALAEWSQALALPSVAKVAAEKLVPLLNELGRQQEAQYLTKRYLKGCC